MIKAPPLTDSETGLLLWLAEADYSQYGECHGPDLDNLIKFGLAQVHGKGEYDSGFITAGVDSDSIMYRAVSLTETGRLEAAKQGEIG